MLNKIIVIDEEIKVLNNDSNIKIDISSSLNNLVKNVYIDILNNSELEIEYNIEENIKLNILINVCDNVKFFLLDKKLGNNIKVKYNYSLGCNSKVIINKINDANQIKEYDQVNLNDKDANIKYVLKTICKTNEHYDIIINHNAKDTKSLVITNGLNIQDGNLNINVTGYVSKGCENSDLIQDNKIINLTDNKCQINPNLLIDEEIVNANHSAHISNFDDNDLFYIESRGINKKNAEALLIKGFLNSNLDNNQEYVDGLIKKYWR